MNAPPPYPRIPHLLPRRGTSDDRVLDDDDARALLSKPVLVEEKLDGANVVVWLAGTRVECALRSGPGGRDRARQLGPLRAWLSQRTDELRELLAGRALYAEWLYLTHRIPYNCLPSYVVGLDVWSPDGSFVSVTERNTLLTAAGLPAPPELDRCVLGEACVAERLLGKSRFGDELMEGVVIRTVDGSQPRIAKILRAGFAPLGDEAWSKGRPRNVLRDRELSWR